MASCCCCSIYPPSFLPSFLPLQALISRLREAISYGRVVRRDLGSDAELSEEEEEEWSAEESSDEEGNPKKEEEAAGPSEESTDSGSGSEDSAGASNTVCLCCYNAPFTLAATVGRPCRMTMCRKTCRRSLTSPTKCAEW